MMSTGDQIVTQLMTDMDPALLHFVTSRIDSFIKWEVVRFFHSNPYVLDTASNIARYVGLDPAMIETELAELSTMGILNRHAVGKMTVYSLSTDPAIRTQVSQFVVASQDPAFRAKAMYHIVRAMR